LTTTSKSTRKLYKRELLSYANRLRTSLLIFVSALYSRTYTCFELLHSALSLAAQCIVIGPVCGFVCVCVCVCGSVTTITQNCVHRSSPNWACR